MTINYQSDQTNEFTLEECGTCSCWNFDVRCKKTHKMGRIQVSYCDTEDEYTIVATSLEDDCDIDEREYPRFREQLERFLAENFYRIRGTEEPCSPFQFENSICTSCGNVNDVKS